MNDKPRSRSPRAPSIALDEAIARVEKVYDNERLHAAPIDVVAKNLGYKGANNGAALSTFASLRYYGLLERPKDGFLAVSKDFERFKFTPDEQHRQALLMGFLKRPQLFSELLESYGGGLPSDPNLRYELIRRGFSPSAAEGTLAVFKRSVEYAGAIPVGEQVPAASQTLEEDHTSLQLTSTAPVRAPPVAMPTVIADSGGRAANATQPLESRSATDNQPQKVASVADADGDSDRILVRLTGGRRAWLAVPHPLYAADKVRLKAQIDLLLTQDEENEL
jgi:hypothetical protein